MLTTSRHRWEHTPEWAFTSKLLISKHQQVQLLEAASVLVAMNQEAASTAVESDHSSASPAASGSSDPREDDLSSTDTTPPPQQADDAVVGSYSVHRSSNRYSNNSSAYSHSYQSTSGASVFSESAPSSGRAYLSHYRQWSSATSERPTTSGTSVSGYDDEDQADLAAAVGLLSCSFGTPKSGPVMLPPDVPPVPPLPAKFAVQQQQMQQNQQTSGGYSYARYPAGDSKDVDMGEGSDESLADEEEFDRRSTSRGRGGDEDEDGVFGRMEY